ncbi:uncharacterized protein DEA37_0011183 [Paragonimus westermani]|uniref:G-protein coupled receptors family 1 profile domain-containing protein n=1 Tax=Paragonimus westermani TaxID=34504 RepID=A0A5J4NLA6_9TREM|nr:uncharacterized protein DEA37_0011183 [Paragonimus westermani]
MADQQDTRVVYSFHLWHIINLAIFSFGVFVNLILTVILTRFRKATESLMTTGIVPSVIDIVICLLCIVSTISPSVDKTTPNLAYFLCHLVFSHAVLWGIISVKMNVHMLTAIFYFVQLLFPFMRVEQRKKSILILLGCMISLFMCLETVPQYFVTEYDENTGQCLLSSRKLVYSVTARVGIILRLLILFCSIYGFILPICSAIYMYHHVLRVLRLRDKSKDSLAYKEVLLNSIQDVWLVMIFSLAGEANKFFSKYPEVRKRRADAAFIDEISMFVLCVYSVIYPCISIALRRRYQRPILDCFVYMGLNPADYWFCRKIGRSETTEERKTTNKLSESSSKKRIYTS